MLAPVFAGCPEQSMSSSSYSSQSNSPFMYDSPKPISALSTVCMNILWSNTCTVTVSESGLPSTDVLRVWPAGRALPRMASSSPLGRIILKHRPGGTHDPPTRLKRGRAALVVQFRWGSHGRGSHGTALLPNILSATCTADRIPSSWNP